jgi:hypothetical protein
MEYRQNYNAARFRLEVNAIRKSTSRDSPCVLPDDRIRVGLLCGKRYAPLNLRYELFAKTWPLRLVSGRGRQKLSSRCAVKSYSECHFPMRLRASAFTSSHEPTSSGFAS